MSATDVTAYGRSWYAATMVETPERPQLAKDLDVDVCVVGGGLAGLTATRELARSGWSVALIEAGRLAARASGRNTGVSARAAPPSSTATSASRVIPRSASRARRPATAACAGSA